MFLGVSAVVGIFNILTYFHVYRLLEWKLRFWILGESLRLAIIVALVAVYAMADEWSRDSLFQAGWGSVILMFLYALVLATTTARDLFEEESQSFKELVEG
jgi:putative flippase GtrA